MKKRDPNQMDLFTMPTPESPDPAPPSPSPEPQPVSRIPPTQPPREPASDTDAIPGETPPDTSFDPSDWDTGEADTLAPPEPEPAVSLPGTTPPVEASSEFDPFESDPFFNPSRSTPSPIPPRVHPTPPPSAEERLLEEIVQTPLRSAPTDLSTERVTATRTKTYTIEALESLSRDLESAVAGRSRAEAELHQARQDAIALRARCETLESERDAARRETEKERQARVDAARLRPAAPFKPAPQDLHSLHRGHPDRPLSTRSLVLALAGVLVLCLFTYSIGRRQSPAGITVMDPDRPAAVISEPPPLPVPPAPVVIPPEKPAAWPSFESDGYRVTGDAATRRVVFHYGVFSTGTTLSEAAQRDLAKIAAAFKADIRSFRIGIEGHTDATPVRSSNAFADNHELAMARANAAMEFMNEKCGIPREAMTAAASDNRNPPHPDTGRESQRKNRTVVLTITRR